MIEKTLFQAMTALVLAIVVALGWGVQTTLATGDVNLNLDSPLKLGAQLDAKLDVNQFLKQVTSVPIGLANPVTVGNCKDSCNRLVQDKPDFLATVDPLLSGSACVLY